MFKLIDDLKRSDPKRREKLIMRTHAKNVEYLERVNPELSKFIKVRGTGPFGIRITDDSLEVYDRATNQLFHPPGELFSYMSELGELHHTAWVDKLLIQHIWRGQGEHGVRTRAFLEGLYAEFPEHLKQRMDAGVVRLPKMKDGRHFSGPVVFLGIFTGLHIMYYLNRTATSDVFLIEPDVDRFALSCFFLDYELVEKQFGRLMLHVGPNAPQYPIDRLTTHAPVTAASWVRLLPAYPDGQFDEILNRVALRWRALTEIYVPCERELQNLTHGLRNIRDGLPLLFNAPALSENATIAIVASGPSLAANMEWLKQNQDRLIIVASISCIRVLKENGIRPDFQCTLDTELDEPLWDQLQLDPDIPLVAYYKLNPTLVSRFKKVLLIHEDGKANAVRFHRSFTHTHPTTGNFMTAFGAWFKPTRLLFVGLDLGFRDSKRSHVQGGWHDDNEGVGHEEEVGQREQLNVTANFPEMEGEILTIAYYNNARFAVEDAIVSLKDTSQILNLSDGAQIAGALPMRCGDLELSAYPEKNSDLQVIDSGFSTNGKEIYEVYDTPGRQLIDELTTSIMDRMELADGFNWKKFADSLDAAWSDAVNDCIQAHREFRIEVFGKLVQDLLGEWYRTIVLAETPENVERLYQRGLVELRSTLSSLPWDAELDTMLPSKTAALTTAALTVD